MIVVEAPRLANVRRRLARLEDLRVVSLDGEGVSSAGAEDEIRSTRLRKSWLQLLKPFSPY